jgi:hypothetical protein
MPDVEEGAVKKPVDAPPADDTKDETEQDPEDGKEKPAEGDEDGGGDDDAAGDGSGAGEDDKSKDGEEDGKTPPEEAEGDKREKMIPRERADQLIAQKNQADEDAKAAREDADKARAEAALSKRSQAAGYKDPNVFARDDEWAASEGYGTIEKYLELQAYETKQKQRVDSFEISEEFAKELVDERREKIKATQERDAAVAREQATHQQTNLTALDQAIAEAREEFKDADPADVANLEAMFKQVGNAKGVKVILDTFRPLISKTAKTTAEKAVIGNNTKRSAAARTPAPEGRGGNVPPAQQKQPEKVLDMRNRTFGSIARDTGFWDKKDI